MAEGKSSGALLQQQCIARHNCPTVQRLARAGGWGLMVLAEALERAVSYYSTDEKERAHSLC